eukprot:UN23152
MKLTFFKADVCLFKKYTIVQAYRVWVKKLHLVTINIFIENFCVIFNLLLLERQNTI